MKDKLKEYVEGNMNYTPIFNILNDLSKNWYAEIGKYIFNKFDGKLPKELKSFEDKIKENKKKFIKNIHTNDNDKERTFLSIGILFLTSTLNKQSLIDMFGNPLMHNEFGEGFEHNKYKGHQFASYFVNIDGYELHIGYDHRGTCIEIEDGLIYPSFQFPPQKLFEVICKIVDLYKEKVN
jgi:hypothetical protein